MKNTVIFFVMAIVAGNLDAMNRAGSASFSKITVSDKIRLDHIVENRGVSKDEFLANTERLHDAAEEHNILKAERDILATVLRTRFENAKLKMLNWVPAWETSLVPTERLQLMLQDITEIAYKERKDSTIETEKVLEVAQCIADTEMDNVIFKSQIMTMKKVLGLATKMKKKKVQKKKPATL